MERSEPLIERRKKEEAMTTPLPKISKETAATMPKATAMPRISKVKAVGPSKVTVTWKDGGTDHVELVGWISTGGDVLARLRDPKVFRTAHVGLYGAMVAWSDDEDLAIDALHLKRIADEQRTIDGEALTEWQKFVRVTNEEAAALFDVSKSTWAAYKSGARIPTVVQMVFRQMRRDPLMMHAHYKPLKGTPGRPSKGT
jgi:hypothetical protein